MTLQNLVGQTLGQYELRELIGTGGMGAVYLGYQSSLKRRVAVKVLSTELVNQPGALERFNREAETSASLEHPHIIHIYDYGTQRGISYLVMQLLSGGSLGERMNHRIIERLPLPSLGEVSDLLEQVGSALDYAHAQGVVHRDIKPSNVMFDSHGAAYLVDFGIAKLAESTSGLTAPGMLVGTFGYMAPEQWKSEPITGQTDQYALAVMAYAVLTGQMPFDAPTPVGLMHKHLNDMPTPPNLVRPGVPEETRAVFERAMAKRPEDRFPSCVSFAQTFSQAIRGSTGQKTGFFVTQVAQRKAALGQPISPSPDRPPSSSGSRAVPLDGEHTFTPSGARARADSIVRPPTGSSPSILLAPVSEDRPIWKHPLMWIFLVIIVGLGGVVAMLAMNRGGGDKTETPQPIVAENPTATATTNAIIIMTTSTPEPVITLPPTAITPEVTPTREPTVTLRFTLVPTEEPTEIPTEEPSKVPTNEPTAAPTNESARPTVAPTTPGSVIQILSTPDEQATLQAQMDAIKTESAQTLEAGLTQTATQWTPTPAPDLKKTAEALLTATQEIALTQTAAAATDTPTATRTFTPSFTPSFTRTPTDTATFTFTPSSTPSFTPTFTATRTLVPTATRTHTPRPTATRTFTPTRTPTRTPTPRPSATPTPATPYIDQASPEQVVRQLVNQGIIAQYTGSLIYQGGTEEIDLSGFVSDYQTRELYEQTLADFVIAVNIQATVNTTSDSCGLMLRRSDAENLYLFVMKWDGSSSFRVLNQGNWLSDYAEFDTRPSLTGAYQIVLVMQGSQLSAFANGNYLGSFSDATFQRGAIRMVMATYGENAESVCTFSTPWIWRLS